jgi:hypothetical protein
LQAGNESGVEFIMVVSGVDILIISDFVGVLHCVFYSLYQRPERAKYHSVGQRPTKGIHKHHSG